MRIKDPSEYGDECEGKGTRRKRCNDNAAARQKARHADRDWRGHPRQTLEEYREQRTAEMEAQVREGVRLDAAMVNRGLAQGRDKAKALIADGMVRVDGSSKVKASMVIRDENVIEVIDQPGLSQGD